MDDSIDNNSIKGPSESLGLALDYQALKKIGLEAIIRLGSDKWTDYNEHDPGITILETLIYALTDLAYRTDFSIEDILAQQQLSPEALAKNQLLTARNALTINPVSLLDFRKLIIDTNGVHNAWVLPQKHAFEASKGLLDIVLDPDDETLSPKENDALINQVTSVFQRHRNICQDLGQIQIRKPFKVYFNLQLTLASGVATEEIIAEVLLRLHQYLANAVQFLSFEEAMARFNGDINSVFDGPALQHGFLPDDALNPALFELRSIDLIPIISDIPGVLNIQELKFRTSIDDLGPFNYLEKNPNWYYQKKFPIDQRPVLAPVQEHLITIKKGETFQHWQIPLVKTSLINLMTRQRKSKLSPAERDVAIPTGQYRDLTAYFSIQEEFPRVYGLDPHGPPPGADEVRLAKIKQLKAYLLIFDQIMANYLAQLANVGELFSWSPEVKQTYFFQGLQDAVNDLTALLVDDPSNDSPKDQQHTIELYLGKLAEFREDKRTFLERRNHFLDHLLARFGLNLSAYTAYLEKTAGHTGANIESREIEAKQRVLSNFKELGAQRGKAFNIYQENTDFSSQYSGLRRWVETLLDFTPESIETFRFNERFIEGNYNIEKPDENPVGEYIFVTDDGSPVDFKELMRIGTDPENYKIDFPKADKLEDAGAFGLSIFKLEDLSQKSNIYRLTRNFDNAEQALKAIDEIVDLFKTYNQTSERVYIIEHLLLRPFPEEKYFGLALLDEDGNTWLQTSQWYSRNNLEMLQNISSEDYAFYEIHLPQQTTQNTPDNSPQSTGNNSSTAGTNPENPATVNPAGRPPTTDQPEQTPVSIGKFVFAIETTDNIQYQVNLHYGITPQLVQLQPQKVFNSIEDASQSISYWLKSLAKFNFYTQPDSLGKFQLFAIIGDLEQTYQFKANDVFENQADAENLIAKWKKQPAIYSFSAIATGSAPITNRIQFVYESLDLSIAFSSIDTWDSKEEMGAVIDALKLWIDQESKIDIPLWKPFYRPWPWDATLQVNPNSPYRYLFNDPFSFVLTVVIPDWPARFQQRAFKETMLQILQAEAPAHLWLNILWLSKSDFQEFQFIYGNWWRAFSRKESGTFYYRKILLDFIMNRSFATQ